MIKVRTKILSVLLVLFLVLPSFIVPLNASAEGTRSLTVLQADGETVKSIIDVMEDDFNSETISWSSDNGSLSTVSSYESAPYSSYEGQSSLLVTPSEGSNGYLSLTKEAKNLISLEIMPIVTMTVFIPEHADNTTLTLCLLTDSGEIKSSLGLEGGSWQTLFFDFSSEKGRAVSNISISVNADGADGFYFLIDCLGGCESRNSIFAAKYMFREFTSSGCELNTDNGLFISFTAGEKYISMIPVVSDFGKGKGIRIAFINSSTCTSITVTVTAPDYSELSKTYAVSAGMTDLILPISNELVSSLKLTFDGDPIGSIDVLSISAVQCYSPQNSCGEITEVRVARDKKSITVSGRVTDAEFELLSGSKLRLYELRLDQDIRDISPMISPVLESVFSSSDFSFSLPIDDNRDRLFKKYAVAAVTVDGLVPIGSAKAINNPGIFAEDKVTHPDSIKGSSYLTANYFLDGIAQTTVKVYADELISSISGSITHTDGGRKYAFSAEYTKELDALMKRYSDDGIAVRMVLLLKMPAEGSALSSIHHPESRGGEYSAFNTASAGGINTLRAITSFLVGRYSCGEASDNLIGIILGSNVNDSYASYNVGTASLSYLTLTYTAAFRTVYNAARMLCSGFEVSVPVNNRWCSFDTASTYGSFEAGSFVRSFSACICDSSDIEWSLSCDITPNEKCYAYEETLIDKTCFAKNVTAANLEVLISYLKQPSVMYNGVARKLVLAGLSQRDAIDDSDRIKLSADYVYTYLRALSMKEICAYIPSHPANYEDVIRYVDSQLFEEKTAFASELIGEERFGNLAKNTEESPQRFYSSVSGGTLPQSVKGKLTLFGFSKNTAGFAPHVNCAVAEGGVSYGEAKGLMRFRLTPLSLGEYGGVSAALDDIIDLSSAPYLTFNVWVSGLPEGVNELECAVVVGSGRSAFVSTSKIYANSESTVLCDLSTFSHASTCDKISIYVRDVYGTDIGEPTLLVGSISALSEKLSGTALKDAVFNRSDRVRVSIHTVIAVMICGFIAIGILILRIVYGFKKRSSYQQNQ